MDNRRASNHPIDPVAAWLLQFHPELSPTIPQPEILSTVRARTEIADRMLAEELALVRRARKRLSLWVFGAGFDARWFRMQNELGDLVSEYQEIEVAPVLELKAKLLGRSPYASSWGRVTRRALEENRWSVEAKRGTRQLVIIEAAPGRLDDGDLRLLLQRIRTDAPNARLLVGLPADTAVASARWSRKTLTALGFTVVEDVRLAGRARLLGPGGHEVAPGMYPLRLVRLV